MCSIVYLNVIYCYINYLKLKVARRTMDREIEYIHCERRKHGKGRKLILKSIGKSPERSFNKLVGNLVVTII